MVSMYYTQVSWQDAGDTMVNGADLTHAAYQDDEENKQMENRGNCYSWGMHGARAIHKRGNQLRLLGRMIR